LYYKPAPEKPENIKMMEIMDKHLTDHPTEGVLSLVLFFIARNYPVGPKRIRRLLKIMGRQTIYRRKNLTKQGMKEFIKPYLLNGLNITHANQVWCTDITYIPMRHGFMYLTAIIDVYSRKIVGWGISNSLAAKWCKDVLEDAIGTYGKPEIVNSDQGTQYTSALWTQFLESEGIQISMDGKGRALDNIWIERFWKSIKYDYVYLNPADDGFELYEGVQNHIAYYNDKTHHTTRQTPNKRYHETLKKAA
jgi:putative transposase